jgi:hypothetical protein
MTKEEREAWEPEIGDQCPACGALLPDYTQTSCPCGWELWPWLHDENQRDRIVKLETEAVRLREERDEQIRLRENAIEKHIEVNDANKAQLREALERIAEMEARWEALRACSISIARDNPSMTVRSCYGSVVEHMDASPSAVVRVTVETQTQRAMYQYWSGGKKVEIGDTLYLIKPEGT